jgi:hypothetical protein
MHHDQIASNSKLYNEDLNRPINDLTYNIYHQYDRAYNIMLSREFGMKYFIYQGGLIGDSRDFCVAHNNKVFSINEAKEWRNWIPRYGKYPEGYKIKAEDLHSVPSYIKYRGYDPLIDGGGYNCRHSLGFISDKMALRMRGEKEEQAINPGLKLNKTPIESEIIIIEKKRVELLAKVDPSAENDVNQLLSAAINLFLEANEPVTDNGKELTLEEVLDLISPKIIETIRYKAEKLKGFLNI